MPHIFVQESVFPKCARMGGTKTFNVDCRQGKSYNN